MRIVVTLCFVIAAACGSKSEATKASSGSGVRITYDVDLDKAIDDKGIEIKRDLESTPGVTAKVSAMGVLTVTPNDPSTSTELRVRISADYAEVLEPRACAPDAPLGSVCVAIAPAYAEAAKRSALGQAAKTVERRLVELALPGATARPTGNQLVVELRGPTQAMLAAMRKLLGRSGVLDFKVVDDGTPFMKRVFQKVGSDGMDGKATDPEAAAAGITAGIDQWRGELTGEEHTDFYLRGPERGSLERYFARLAAADPTFAVPAERILGFELRDPEGPGDKPLWRSYLLVRKTDLTGAALANAEMQTDSNVHRPIVLLEFGRAGGRVFGELTGRIAGKKLAVVLDGTIKSAPIINGPILGGRASITMGGTDLGAQLQDANELALVLRSGSLPAPLHEISVEVIP